MVAIVLFIVKDSVVITDPEGVLHSPLYLVSWAVMIVALVLTIVSMLDYFAKARGLWGFRGARGGTRARGRAAQAAAEAGTRRRRLGGATCVPHAARALRDARWARPKA